MSLRKSPSPLIGLLALATGTLCGTVAGCGHPSAARGVSQPPARNDFVGNEACADCHASEFRSHRASRHAVTLRAMSRKSLGALFPPLGPIPAANCALTQQGQEILFARKAGAAEAYPIQLAFGSGKTGMTYVHLVDSHSLMELQMSYFPRFKRWKVTPGQDALDETLGRVHASTSARRCILCHATTLAAGTVNPEPRFYGVGCEACHGPGGAHVAARRSGDLSAGKMEDIGSAGARRINELCGNCHRTEKDVNPLTTNMTETQRFQPYGLMRSPCFQNSRDTLSCLTCHDPHTNASTDPKDYEAVCLKCHAPRPAADASTTLASAGSLPGKVCPVNPRNRCIGCHMPSRPVFHDPDIPITMADHFIWAYRKRQPSLPR